ncbi:MAG TPA: hypothetical protein ENK59_01685 [Thioploca sp.]|nr:hypothetical protein [Thioploca sp.]
MRINQPVDPVIRKRVRITENSYFITKWLSILVIVAIISGGIYFGMQSSIVNQETSLISVPNKISDIPIQDVNSIDISDKLLKDNSAETSQINLMPVTIQLPVKSEVKPIIDIQNTHLETLLNKANKQIAMKRLTSPKGNNAYETYQIILKEYPQQAQKVLDNIVAWYFTQGKNFINKNRLTTKFNGRNSAYKMYQKLAKIAPNHKDTNGLLNLIITKLDERAKIQLNNDKLINNAYIIYQELFKVAPDNLKTKQLLTNIINKLLAKAKKQMAKQQYSTPKDNNAVDTFKYILTIAPDNIKAKTGLKTIVKKYYKLALRKYKQGRYKGSMTWLERGLKVSYNDPELNDLKKQVSEKIK